LIANVYRKLAEAYGPRTGEPSDSEIDAAIQDGFLALDREIVWSNLERVKSGGSKRLGAQLLAPAISGSCALLAFYDTGTQRLRVACAGDSRAVLGRRSSTGPAWCAIPLSADQTGENPVEVARIQAEHPDEPEVVKQGRVVGMEPSRAFGDADFKWTRAISMEMRKLFHAHKPPEGVKTPPYITAEPVITTTRIHPERGDFVVLASDSLWEMLSNEEVVGLVGRWIDEGFLSAPLGKVSKKKAASVWNKAHQFLSPGDNTFTSNVTMSHCPESGKAFGRQPVRPQHWKIGKRRRTPVVEDSNAATHLARNGLVGDDHDFIASLFMLGGSNTRRYR